MHGTRSSGEPVVRVQPVAVGAPAGDHRRRPRRLRSRDLADRRIISRAISPLRTAKPPSENTKTVGIERAGRAIGYLERVLILTFVLLGEYTAIGFLVTAKSILRYEATRVEGEYILIGTLASFTAAILIGVAVNLLV